MALQADLVLEPLPMREQLRFCGYALFKSEVDRGPIARLLKVHPSTVSSWQKRYECESITDFSDAPRSGRRRIYGADIQQRFIAFYCQTTTLSNSGRWTLRLAAAKLKGDPDLIGASMSRSTMQRILSQHALKPHLNRYFLHITDPCFFPKMERIIRLYKGGAKNLYCFDECPGIQVLRRIVPDMRPDAQSTKAWLKEFEYLRNGTLDLFAFLDVGSGQVFAQVHENHTKETFLKIFREHVAQTPSEERIDYIMDNLASHCSYDFCQEVAKLSNVECPDEKELNGKEKRREWLQSEDKRIVITFTPFHGSWLNMVEIFFRIIQKGCLEDSYNTPDDLMRAITEYVELWNNELAHPFSWKYNGEGLPKKAVIRFTALLQTAASGMTLQFFTKSFRLMMNLMKEHREVIEQLVWNELFEAIKQAAPTLKMCIEQSAQPQVKMKAELALYEMLEHIEAFEQASRG